MTAPNSDLTHERVLLLEEQDTIQDASPFQVFEHPNQLRIPSASESEETDPLLVANGSETAVLEDTETDAELLLREHRAHTLTLPWNQRPTTLLICLTTSLFFIAMGISISAKISVFLQKICDHLTKTHDLTDCHDSSVQKTASSMQSGLLLVKGTVSCLMSGKLGELSDRHGRKPIFIVIGVLTCVSKFFDLYLLWPTTPFSYFLFFTSNVIEGLGGGVSLVLSLANSYITDIVDPHKRNVSMGYVMGSFFTGIAMGPLLGSVIVKWFKDTFLPLWIDAALSVLFLLSVLFVVPESRSLKLRRRSQSMHFQRRASFASQISMESNTTELSPLHYVKLFFKEMFHSLGLLWLPKHSKLGYIPRYNVIILLFIDVMNMLVVQSIGSALVLYTTYRFNWSAVTIGYFISASGIGKALVLYTIAPFLLPFMKKQMRESTTSLDNADRFLVYIVALSELIHPLLIAVATTSGAVFASVIFGCFGALSSPVIQSSITKYIPESKMGELFGAIALIKNSLSMFGPPLFLYIYSNTVDTYPQAVFYFAVFLLTVSLGSATFLKVVNEEKIALDYEELGGEDSGNLSAPSTAGSEASLFRGSVKSQLKVSGR
ncbi:hypothetical protein WICPIJ_004141 [Wickerhamomyces pijperi]|uniref:Major facilitator superfamily (MFS) profile domain-containing protein n=1 Tax=Wickerhamomyces pijperi TaxID=599730 RepID=A0A9P8Q8J2_WICPI|nr:hypothetical protein WICPIJ_004141 [Wickerhamomyces pijperi]